MQVTYHANKLQENQYTLHVAVMIRKIRKLRQFGSDLERDSETMRKILSEAESARSRHLPNSKNVIWQQITSGKHYSHEFDPRNILKPWDQVITEIAEKAAKVHYKDSKILGKVKRIHVDQEPKRITIPNF